MFNRYGLLTRSNKSEIQDTIRDPDFGRFLYDLYIQDGADFLGDLNGWCTTSSRNRCCFYMSLNYENKKYVTQKNRKIPYILPTYGVKGTDAISRDMKYVNQYLQKYEEVLGNKFVDYVFGTEYVKHEEPQELVSKSETVERLRRKIKRTSHTVEDRELVCRIMERIWTAREQDSKTRVLIVLENAQQESLNLLRQLYLLMPQKLRVQTGFETNVAAGDLDVISKNSLPMYILTVDRADVDKLTREYLRGLKFPVEFVEVDAIHEYPCDSDRLGLLKYHCEQLSQSAATDICVDYAERKVMEENKQNYSSFRIYEKILRKTYSSDLFWWKMKELTSIEQIFDVYRDQEELMIIPRIKEEAVWSFYTEWMTKGNFAEQIVEIVSKPEYPNRVKLLQFLREEFYLEKELAAVEKYSQKKDAEQLLMQDKHMKELRELADRSEREKKEKLDRFGELLRHEKNQAISALEEKHAEEMRQKMEEMQRLADEKRQQRLEMEKALKDEQKICAEMEEKKDSELSRITNEKRELQAKYEEMKRRLNDVPKRKNKDEENNVEEFDSLKEKYDALEKKYFSLEQGTKRVKNIKNLFGVFAVFFAAAGIGISAFFFLKMQTMNRELSIIQRKETERVNELETKGETESEEDVVSENNTEAKVITEAGTEIEFGKESEREMETDLGSENYTDIVSETQISEIDIQEMQSTGMQMTETDVQETQMSELYTPEEPTSEILAPNSVAIAPQNETIVKEETEAKTESEEGEHDVGPKSLY